MVRAVGVLDAARDDDLLRVHARGVLEERGHEEGSILPADHRASDKGFLGSRQHMWLIDFVLEQSRARPAILPPGGLGRGWWGGGDLHEAGGEGGHVVDAVQAWS